MKFSNKSSILVDCTSYAEQEEMSKDISQILEDSDIVTKIEKMDDGETYIYSRIFDFDITTDASETKRGLADVIFTTISGAVYSNISNSFEYEKNVDVRDYITMFILKNKDSIRKVEYSDVKFSIIPYPKFSIGVIANHKTPYDLSKELSNTFKNNGVFFKRDKSEDEMTYILKTTMFDVYFYTPTLSIEFPTHVLFDSANKEPFMIRSDFKGKIPNTGESYKKYITDILMARPIGFGYTRSSKETIDWLK